MRKGITVVCTGYNEEKRAEQFFKSISMFDEIIYKDRSSTDRTCEIAKKYNVKIVNIPYVETEKEHLVTQKYNKVAYESVSNEWVLNLTFADIVHPQLYSKLIKLINKPNFEYTVVKVPWVEYLFGKEDEYIPFCHYFRPVLRRRDVIKNSVVTHQELQVTNRKEFKMPKNKRVAVHHMTYTSLQYSFLEQNVRYALQEYATYYSELEQPKKELFRLVKTCIKNQGLVFLKGIKKRREKKIIVHAGILLLYRAVVYYLLLYLVIWSNGKNGVFDSIIEIIYEGVQKSEKRKQIPKRQLLKMGKKVLFKASTSLGEDLMAYFSIIIIWKIMIVIYIWDNKQNETPEEVYEKLKIKILNDV